MCEKNTKANQLQKGLRMF